MKKQAELILVKQKARFN